MRFRLARYDGPVHGGGVSVVDRASFVCADDRRGLSKALSAGQTWVALDCSGKVSAYSCAYMVRRDVVELVRCAVHPAYRGHGLQRRLTAIRCVWGVEHGATMALATVAVDNYSSLATFERAGFCPVREVRNFGVVLRVLRKELVE